MRQNILKILKAAAVTALCILGITAVSLLRFDWSCPIHSLTGLYCPGCGATRMALKLLQADITGAFHENACLLILIIPLFIYIAVQLVYYIKHGKFLRNKIMKTAEVIFIALFLIFGILRNIPYFEFLQPM